MSSSSWYLVGCLEQHNQLSGLRCELMSELGALLMHSGDVKLVVIDVCYMYTSLMSLFDNRLAGKWWDKALEELVGVADHMTLSAVTIMESSGLWGCILAGILATRLAQLSHTPCRSIALNDLVCVGTVITMNWTTISCTYKCLLNSLRCIICGNFVATQRFCDILQVLLKGNISIPNRDIDYAVYTIEGINLLPGLDVFSKPFHCNAHSVADALQYVCEQLVHSNQQYTEVVLSYVVYSTSP